MSLSFEHWKKFKEDRSFQERYILRSKFLQAIREFFLENEFIETDTPLMVRQCGLEPNLTPFETDLLDRDGKKYKRYLITSPEHHMKMLLCAGCTNIFQICKCFRNSEEGSPRHNPEFMMLEWYRTNADYTAIMSDMEELFLYVAKKVFGKITFVYQGISVDLTKAWERITVAEAFSKFAGVENLHSLSRDDFAKHGERLEVSINPSDDWDDIFYKIFLTHIESKLGHGAPTILCEYPAHMAALAIRRGDVCERFEAYIAGLELCNGFTELTDAKEQRARFIEEKAERKSMGKNDLPLPENFLNALDMGMPPAGGNALGLDRMFMIMSDTPDIKDIVPFAEFWE